ncbi:kinetochore Sim4 complex subunit FTA2-domain-containing protein [Diaporthe sp. PMI_573]|nr:kinetochore Sim4 complex subunit FTA2-domain-containing protein [Diaporthaceae sp. PMI_573]
MSDLIPHIRGPKLAPFHGDIEKFELVRLLRPDQSQKSHCSGSIGHSRVFQVNIRRKKYALKIFNFFTIDELQPFAYGREHFLTVDVVRHQRDPFYAECRAFGLLTEHIKDNELAVRCHGYTFLPASLERRIHQQFGINDWNRQEEHEGQPLRAILKDYIIYHSVCGRKTLSKMRENITKLNGLGIYNMDIREDNYRGGRLFDFSLAITSPHISLSLNIRTRKAIETDRRYDIEEFKELEAREKKRRKYKEKSEWARGERRELRQRETRTPKYN